MGLTLATAISIPIHHVGLIQLFDYSGKDRNDPESIRRRIVALGVSNTISVLLTCAVLGVKTVAEAGELFGLQYSGSAAAAVAVGLHTCILYAPNIIDYIRTFDWREFKREMTSLMTFRDTIVAPLGEEIAFRACAASLVSATLAAHTYNYQTWSIWLTPWLFALSHLHLIGDDIRRGYSMKEALMRRGFQVTYSYAFGVYATLLFFRTRHLSAPIVCHMICNSFGLPLIADLLSHNHSNYRSAMIGLSFMSLGAFIWFFPSFTDPSLFY